MAILPINDYCVFNGELIPSSQFKAKENTGSIYEVLRIVRGVPLFLSDHLLRLIQSANLAGISIAYSGNEIENLLVKLIQANNVSAGNIMISCKVDFSACFIPHKYPGIALYENGIQLGVLHAERQNPNAKVFQTSVRQQANDMKLTNDFYEVLLVDHLNRITEGSSSNVFFIRENKLVTTPESDVLPGITRQKTIEIAHRLNLDLEEQSVYLEELSTFNAAFITGTSPKILPVKQIGDIRFDPQHLLIGELIKAYDRLIEDYVSSR